MHIGFVEEFITWAGVLLDISLPSGMDIFYQKEKGKSENSKY